MTNETEETPDDDISWEELKEKLRPAKPERHKDPSWIPEPPDEPNDGAYTQDMTEEFSEEQARIQAEIEAEKEKKP